MKYIIAEKQHTFGFPINATSLFMEPHVSKHCEVGLNICQKILKPSGFLNEINIKNFIVFYTYKLGIEFGRRNELMATTTPDTHNTFYISTKKIIYDVNKNTCQLKCYMMECQIV